MTRRTRYPSQYTVPSQAPSQLPPYFPGAQADTDGFAELQKVHAPGHMPQGVFVVSTFDARPISTVDFLKTIDPATDFWAPNGALHLVYNVPLGRTLVMRDWFVDGATLWDPPETPPGPYTQVNSLSVTGGFGGSPSTNAPPNDPVGANNVPNGHLLLSLAVNGSVALDFGSKIIDDAYTGSIDGETYIIAPEAAVVEMILANSAGHTVSVFNAGFHGNLLLATSYAVEMQPGTQQKIPVTTKAAERLNAEAF